MHRLAQFVLGADDDIQIVIDREQYLVSKKVKCKITDSKPIAFS